MSQDAQDAAAVERCLRKYRNFDPDLADLSLLALAARTGVREIVTADAKDLAVYRVDGDRALTNLLAG